MKANLLSIIVGDQDQALAFYRDVLGFVPKVDIPAGGARWITLGSPDGGGADISLEPNGYDFVNTYQQTLKDRGIPLTAFAADDVQAEYDRLTAAGVVFKGPPKGGDVAMPKVAMFDDTCGNWIMIAEEPKV